VVISPARALVSLSSAIRLNFIAGAKIIGIIGDFRF